MQATDQRQPDSSLHGLPQAPRRHPDIFTTSEAAAYLGLESERSLETIRKDYGLVGHRPAGKAFMYHRSELDRVALKMFGLTGAEDSMKGGRR